MKLLVFGDTHIPKRAKKLPDRLVDGMKEADMLIHTGDWQSREIYEQITAIGSVKGVYGNVDDAFLTEALSSTLIWEEKGFRIGLTHGHEGKGSSTEARVINMFTEPLDLVLFGHSHIPYLRSHGRTLFVNPGSATDRRRAPFCSFAWIELGSEGIEIRHVFY